VRVALLCHGVTTTVARMKGWMPHAYSKLPVLAKVYEYVAPELIVGEWNAPLSATTVCGSWSWLIQVTVPPVLTVSVAGANAKLSMLMASPTTGAVDDGAGWVPGANAGEECIIPMPGMPGVTLADPKSTVGGGCDAVEAQLASSSATAASRP
jgi:hypothetical protein